MLARFAPMRSCMMADCLRSIQVCSPARFRTPKKTMPTSVSLMSRSASLAYRLLPEIQSPRSSDPRTRATVCRHREKDLLGSAPGERAIESSRDVQQQRPVFPRAGQRRERTADALDSPVTVDEAPVLLEVRGRRQDPVCRRSGAIVVRARVDQEIDRARQRFELRVADERRQVVPEDPQRVDASA